VEQIMTCTIEIRFHPIYELFNSLHVYTHQTFYKKIEKGAIWRKALINQLSSNLVDALNSDRVDNLVILSEYILTQPVSSLSIDQLLEKLTQVTKEEVMDHFQNHLLVSDDNLESKVGTFDQTIKIVKKWKKEYFDQLDISVMTALEADYLQKREQMDQNKPFDFVEKVTNGFVLRGFDDLTQVILYPTYHSSPIVTYSHYRHLHIYGYPVDITPISEGEPSPTLMQRGIVLSDKNRLQILRFLGKEEKSFTDIVKFIGLAKSTVHHHMVHLRASGLVQIILSPATTERYRLREKGLQNIFQHYFQFLFPSDLKKGD
jgi:DNA-binding transcriptional ArsR family regulator